MPDPAQAIYPNGPSKSMGNQRMPKVFDVPVSKEAFDEKWDGGKSGKLDLYSKDIYDFAEANRLIEGDTIRVRHPDGEIKHYKWLGKDSGGDWDYMEIKQQKEVPTS